MSQICGMLNNLVIYLEVGITGQIDRLFRLSLIQVSHGAPPEMTGGTKGGAQRVCSS
jgi:hypothetical protein